MISSSAFLLVNRTPFESGTSLSPSSSKFSKIVFETSGSLSRNKLDMRYGGINNYWRLWKKQKIDLSTMIFYVQYTSLKAVMSILFPKLHLFFRQKLELFLFN